MVTGSRLRRDDLSAPSPTVLVSNQESSSGRGTLEALLNELPQLRADTGGTTQNIGQAGLHTADLRGLRPERTLVLVTASASRRRTRADWSTCREFPMRW